MNDTISCPCGKVIEHESRLGLKRKYCSKECRPSKYIPVSRDRTCVICDSAFTGRASAMYCSEPCKRTGRTYPPCDVCGLPTTCIRPNSRGFFRHQSCVSEIPHGTRAGYRDRECRCVECTAWNANAALTYKRNRRDSGNPIPKRSWIAASTRAAIYERDGNVCQLCFEPIEMMAHFNSNWAPSLDHIKPSSLGGEDESENLRAAHRWCNSVRSDGKYHDDLFV